MKVWENGGTVAPPRPGVATSGFRASSEYGMRYHPIDKVWRLHAGLDTIGYSIVCAPEAGIVQTGYAGGYGNLVTLNADSRAEHRLAHNSSFLVAKGSRVVAGQPVAVMGTTGASTGIHCHHEIYVNGKSVDPRSYMASVAGGGASPFPGSGGGGDEDMQIYIKPTNFGKVSNPNIVYAWDTSPGGHVKALSTVEWNAIDYCRTRGFPVPFFEHWTGAQLDDLISHVGVMILTTALPNDAASRPTYEIMYSPNVEGYVPVHAQNLTGAVEVTVDTAAIIRGVLEGIPNGNLTKGDVQDAVTAALDTLTLRSVPNGGAGQVT